MGVKTNDLHSPSICYCPNPNVSVTTPKEIKMKSLLILAISLVVAIVVLILLPLPNLVIAVLGSMLGANALMCLGFALVAESYGY
jgi:hypothetical protein